MFSLWFLILTTHRSNPPLDGRLGVKDLVEPKQTSGMWVR